MGIISVSTIYFAHNYIFFCEKQSPIKELEDEKKEHEERLHKMEKEMEEVFDRKVREKEKKLSETENELRQKLKEAQEKLDEQREDLEEKMAVFDKVKKIRHIKKFSLEHILPPWYFDNLLAILKYRQILITITYLLEANHS